MATRTIRTWASVLALLAIVAVLLVAFTAWLLRDPESYYLARKSHIATIDEGPREIIDGAMVQTVRLIAESGLVADLTLKIPLSGRSEPSDPYPLALILGGLETGRDAVRFIGDTPGVVSAALSYPYHGPHRLKGFDIAQQLPAIRRGILDTPAAALLAIEYLVQRPEVDQHRIELIGVSLGALFVPAIGALDTRVQRVWSLHGAGDPYALLEHNLRRHIESGTLRHAATWLANVLMNGPGIAPERWAPRIAPRPFIMINAHDDERIPESAVQTLYDAANDPKELIWMPGKHIMLSRPETVQYLVDLVLQRIVTSVPGIPNIRPKPNHGFAHRRPQFGTLTFSYDALIPALRRRSSAQPHSKDEAP